MDRQKNPDLSYYIGKILFSIPATTFLAALMLLATLVIGGRLRTQICIVAFLFSCWGTVVSVFRTVRARRFLHPDLFALLACIGTCCLGLFPQGALGMVVYSICRSVLVTETDDMRQTVTYGPDLPGYSEEYRRLLDAMDGKPAPVERTVKKGSAYFSLIAVGIILALTVLVPLLWRLTYKEWLRRAFILLSAAGPGALFFAAGIEYYRCVNLSAVYGILYRSRSVIQRAARVTSVVFSLLDEPSGEVRLASCLPAGISEDELLSLAAYACEGSGEPYADLIRRRAPAPADASLIEEHTEHPGKGSSSRVGGLTVAAGTAELMEELGIGYVPADAEGNALYVSCGTRYAGALLFAKASDPVSPEAVQGLHEIEIDRIVLLSETLPDGLDASIVGIREVFTGLSRDQAKDKMRNLQQMQLEGELLAYVSDGFRSTELMNAADLCLSVGTGPSVSEADIIIPGTDEAAVATALRLCKNVHDNVRFNLIAAIAAKILILIVAVAGWGGIWLAVLLDAAAAMLVIPGAAGSLLRTRKSRPERTPARD